MDDAELDRRLAKVMLKEWSLKEGMFSYKDPAIFAENVKWLIEHDWLIMEDAGVTIVDYRLYPFGDVQDTEPEKAVTLARLAATEIYKAGE